MKFSGISSSTTASATQQPSAAETEDPIREVDGELSVEVAEKMLKWHAEAIGRCVELSPPNDVAKNTFALLRVLAEAIGNAYIEAAIETYVPPLCLLPLLMVNVAARRIVLRPQTQRQNQVFSP